MFSHEKLQRPKAKSIALTFIVAVASFYSQQISAFVGYLLCLVILVMMIIVSFFDLRWWPNKKSPENPIIFSLLWGLIIGLLIPFLISRFMEDGLDGVLQELELDSFFCYRIYSIFCCWYFSI
jgi:RsiW-degrading membrane proteinase PrsW (M82 family)